MISSLLADSQGQVTSYTPHDLLSVSMDQKVILSMMLPASTPQDYILSYKVKPRKQVRLEMKECIINPMRAKFFRESINIYLHFVSYLHIDTTQVVEILPQIRQEPTYSTVSIMAADVLAT